MNRDQEWIWFRTINEYRHCQNIDIYSYETRKLDRKMRRSKDRPGHSSAQRLEKGEKPGKQAKKGWPESEMEN